MPDTDPSAPHTVTVTRLSRDVDLSTDTRDHEYVLAAGADAPPGYTLTHWHDPSAVCLRHAHGGCYWEARFPAQPTAAAIAAAIRAHRAHCRIAHGEQA